jgi:pyruvate formate lyase activating enzyme
MPQLPLVIDIKRYSFEDGPGIRSVVFFKGCPLRCIFCHNPESQELGPEIAFSEARCIGCGACEQACPLGAVDPGYPGHVHRERCNLCGKCAEVCPTDALKFIGEHYSAESLTQVLLRDLEYYRHSGGGVTFSGGECTLYPQYLEAVLKGLKVKDVHIIVETSGCFEYNTFRQKIYPNLDLIYYDIKLADSEAHNTHCGKPNEVILRNFDRLIGDQGAEVQARIPLVPGITATHENLSAIARLLRARGVRKVWLLPYNPTGLAKYETLARPTPDLPTKFMTPDEENLAYDALRG